MANIPGTLPDEPKRAYGLVALLDEEHTTRVHQIWRLLEEECGLIPVNVPPYPHVSFHVARSYQLPELDQRLSEITQQIHPFSVQTTGLGIFTGSNPVVYLPVVATKTLLDVHQRLWEQTHQFGQHLNRYYQPGEWVPHITLVQQELTTRSLECIFEHCIERAFVWEIAINELGVIFQNHDGSGIHKMYPLGRV